MSLISETPPSSRNFCLQLIIDDRTIINFSENKSGQTFLQDMSCRSRFLNFVCLVEFGIWRPPLHARYVRPFTAGASCAMQLPIRCISRPYCRRLAAVVHHVAYAVTWHFWKCDRTPWFLPSHPIPTQLAFCYYWPNWVLTMSNVAQHTNVMESTFINVGGEYTSSLCN